MPFRLGHHSRLLRFQPSGSSQYVIEYRYLAAVDAIFAVFTHSCQLVLEKEAKKELDGLSVDELKRSDPTRRSTRTAGSSSSNWTARSGTLHSSVRTGERASARGAATLQPVIQVVLVYIG